MNTEQLKRLEALERVCEGLTQDHIDGGWTAKGLTDHCAKVERERDEWHRLFDNAGHSMQLACQERDQLRRMFNAAVLDLVAVGEALGIPGEQQGGGSAEFVEAIKRLSECAQGVIPSGYTLVPSQMFLDAESLGALLFVGGGPEADDGTPTFCDCVMWVGELPSDDDGKVYGLHAYCTECEEEGSTTLAEFERTGLLAEQRESGND